MRDLDEVDAELSAPGQPFERRIEEVRGTPLEVFRHRAPHLRAILEASRRHGDDTLFVFEDGPTLSFVEHADAVASVAAGLRERYGIGPGDRVAFLGENSAPWVVGAWATLSLGAVVVGMNGWWKGDEIRYGLELSDPALLIADRKRLARVPEGSLRVPCVVMEDDFDALWHHAPGAVLPEVPIDEDDPATLLFTSGTTGRPKGAISSHRNLVAFLDMMRFSAVRTLVRLGMPADAEPPRSVAIASAPLFHVSGFQSCALSGPYGGSTLIWTRGRFDPVKIFRLTEEHRVTRWGGVTAQLALLMDHSELDAYDLSSVRSVGGGGSFFGPELQAALRARLPKAAAAMTVGYGMTECGGLATIATDDMLRAHPHCVGRAMPTVEVGIFDDEDRPVADGRDGNICVRGAMVMPGYWRNEEASAEALRPGGWLKTGDVGQIREGLLYLAARKRDLILRGSENVYPIEIEQRLEAHPEVQEAAVFGVDHPTLGQEIHAVVVPSPGTVPDPEALREWVAETLADYKVPREIELRNAPLPRNATGKVLKNVVSGERENPFVEDGAGGL